MANREALRELQTRLATRLKAARTEGRSVQWLAVEAGVGRYLIALAQAGEIFPFTSVQPAPYTQPWFLGVANLRGGLCGVADLAVFLGAPAQPARGEADRSECSLVTFNAALDLNCALLVDRLAGLRGPEAFSATQPPAEGAAPYLGPTHVDAAGLQWQELNLMALSQFPSFLSISA